MSIINQTLRELDARQAAPASLAAPVVSPRRRSVLRVLAVFLLPVAAAVAGLVWSVRDTPSAPPPLVGQSTPATLPAASVTEPASVVTVLPSAAPAVPRSAAAAAAPAGSPAVVAAPPVQRSVTVPAARSPLAALGVEHPTSVIALAAPPPAAPAAQTPIRHETRQPTPAEIADEHYRKALVDLDAGRRDGAHSALIAVLDAAPAHADARQALAALFARGGQIADAEAVLRHGHALSPDHPGLALGLARLQAAGGDTRAAAATLLDTIGARGVGAEYRATLAALLVQLDRPDEAARHYEQALRQQPGQGTWWAGLAISLEAQGKLAEARTAYQRALQTGALPDDLAAFARAKTGK